MYQLIYLSSASEQFTQQALDELLEKAREKNRRLCITGMLVYRDGNFIQVLEGERDAVEKLYETISRDMRHSNSIVINSGDIAERQFADWAMDFRNAGIHGKFSDAELKNDKTGSLNILNDFIKNMR